MDKIEELLTRGVDSVYPTQKDLEKVLRSGKKLKLYQGFDPTGIQMHIGHMIGLRKLRQWQELGHEVIFLIGDGTGQAGDPSGKTRAREKYLKNQELRNNAKDYVLQAGKIVHFEGKNAAKILYNGDWLNKLTTPEILDIIGNFSLQQLAERDLFQERMKQGETVNMREFFYPILQGYDSVAMEVDLELGGSDQMFNMLCGRTLVKAMLKKDKFVMTTPLLTDSQGKKIGKTEGNVIALNDTPQDLYGKIMGLSDDVIIKGLEYLTDIPMAQVQTIEEKLKQGENPVKFKKQLAFEIVKQLNTQDDAAKAQEYFEKTVQNKELPQKIAEVTIDAKTPFDEDLLVQLEFASSRNEAKRLFQQGGVYLNEEKIENPQADLPIPDNSILRVGKRRIVRIKLGN